MKTATATGSVASFWSPKATNIKSFKIYFDPLQDGRGTPDPENIRPINGQYWIRYYNFPENMLQPVPSSRETYGVVMTTNADGTVEFEGTPSSYSGIKAGDVYLKEGQTALYGKIIGDDDRVSFNTLQLYDDNNTYVAGIATGWEVSTTEDRYAYADLTSYPTATRANINIKRTWNEMYMHGKCFPLIVDSLEKVQSISTDRIKFHFNSKNLFEITSASAYRRGVNWEVRNESVKIFGTPTGTSDFVLGTMDLPEEGGTIVISSTISDCTNIIWDYCTLNDTDGNVVYSFKETTPNIILNLDNYPSAKTLTLKLRIDQVYVEASGFFRVMVEKGDTPSGEYEPYNTPLYGGYVDLVTGEIWKTHHHYVFTGDETFYTSGSNWITSFIPPVNGETMRAYGPSWSGVCTHYPYGPYKQGAIGVMYGENTCTFDFRIRDAEGWKAFAKEQYDAGTPIEVAYRLRDSILLGTLTPQQLSAFIGRNNFFSNATKVEVEYEYADSPQLEVIKKRIALNEPYLATVEGTVGHFYTDMAAPVKSLKVSFSPRQPGTGDASPTNVKPILGFDSINVKRCGINLLQCDTFNNMNSHGIKYEGTRNSEGEIESIHVYGTSDQNNCFSNLNTTINKIKLVPGSFGFYGYADDGVNIYPITNRYGFPDRNGMSIGSGESNWHIIDIPEYKLDNSNHAWVRIQSIADATGHVGESIDTTVYPMMCVEEDVGCDFEPYHGDTYTVSFSELGTQYGGYVDLVKGELTVTWNKISIKDATVVKLDDSLTAAQNFQIFPSQQAAIGFQTTTCPFICDTFMALPQSGSSISTRVNIVVWQSAVDGTFRVKTQEYCSLTADEFKEQFGDVQFAYQLRNPITYQLTPQQIKTFQGTNNVYSFDGTVDVKYWLHSSDVKTEP